MKKNTLLLSFIPVLAAAISAWGTWHVRPALDCGGALTVQQIAEARNIEPELIPELLNGKVQNLQQLCRLSQTTLETYTEALEHQQSDGADEEQAQRQLQMLDEHGQIPDNAYRLAQQRVREMRTLSAQKASINPELWKWMGPGNIGGRTRSVLVDPDDVNRLWIGSVAGGIWVTQDRGENWAPVDDFMANLAISGLVMHPVNHNILYAATGDGLHNRNALRGAGIFQSLDRGNTWQQLSSTANENFYYVNRLAFSPDGQILLAGTEAAIWRSTDGGMHWKQVHTGRTLSLQFAPGSNQKVIASSTTHGLWSDDGGLSFHRATGLPTTSWRTEIRYAPSNANVLYVSLEVNYTRNGAVYRSDDGGHSYYKTSDQNMLNGQGWHNNALWVDPSNENRLVVGGVDLWRSIDGGKTFIEFSDASKAPLSPHADQHVVAAAADFNGSTNKTVYAVNDGGIYRIDDVFSAMGDKGFTSLNHHLGITQFYGVATGPNDKLLGGTHDNGTLLYKGDPESWIDIAGGDGGFAAADSTDSNYVYGEYQYTMIHRSTDGGSQNAAQIISTMEMAAYNDHGNFISPFILDPNNVRRMLVGGSNLWQSLDVKADTPTWTSIKAPVVASGNPISAITIIKGKPNSIWVGHNDGSIFHTDNGLDANPSWQAIGVDTLPKRYATRIAANPTHPNIIYIAFGGFSDGNLWKTSDGGKSWTDVSGSGAGDLPFTPIRAIAINPVEPKKIYLGTEVGIFTSEDAGMTWRMPQEGPANVSVDELIWKNNWTLVAATHGRGIFEINVNQTLVP